MYLKMYRKSGQGLAWLEPLASTNGEHLGHLYQLASMWTEGKEGQMTLDSNQISKKQNQTIHHQPYEADPILKDE